MEYSNRQIRDIIAEYVHSERNRALLCRRLIDGITIERLAEEFELSVSQVKRILKKDGAEIFRHLPMN